MGECFEQLRCRRASRVRDPCLRCNCPSARHTKPVTCLAHERPYRIPIVFATGDDPVKVGLVARLNRPGGNITSISFFNSADLESKQLELLREVVPKAGVIGVLVNPRATGAESQESEAQVAARALAL